MIGLAVRLDSPTIVASFLTLPHPNVLHGKGLLRMSEAMYFDDLRIGESWQSRARTITETDVVNFAGMTGDYDPLHVDHEHARQTPFGKPIAHGLLGLSLLAGLSSTCPAVHTSAFLGIREWEFMRPLLIGDTVHVVTTVIDLAAASPRHGRVVWQRQLINQAGDVIQKGVFETLVSTSNSRARRDEQGAASSVEVQPKPHTPARDFSSKPRV